MNYSVHIFPVFCFALRECLVVGLSPIPSHVPSSVFPDLTPLLFPSLWLWIWIVILVFALLLQKGVTLCNHSSHPPVILSLIYHIVLVPLTKMVADILLQFWLWDFSHYIKLFK